MMKSIPHHHSGSPKVMTLGELAKKTNALLRGDPNTPIYDVGTIVHAKPGDITFLASMQYRKYLASTTASAIVLTPQDAQVCDISALISPDPKWVFAQCVRLLYPLQSLEPTLHPSTTIGDDSQIHPQSYIGPNCVVGQRVRIGQNVILQAGCFIGDDCEIGQGTVLYPNVTVYHGTTIGENCNIHSGVVIGSDGFGFTKHQERWIKVPQVGNVTIGDRVEIGANTTIDRGAIEDTEIGNDVILDNLIQIAHNVKIGDGCAIAACCGIAGSAIIGKHCMIGGGTRIIGHITIADYVNIVASSNVSQSITKPGAYASGMTVTDIKTWKRNLVRFRQLDDLAMRIIEVERTLKKHETMPEEA